jgi:hypothetical protein
MFGELTELLLGPTLAVGVVEKVTEKYTPEKLPYGDWEAPLARLKLLNTC